MPNPAQAVEPHPASLHLEGGVEPPAPRDTRGASFADALEQAGSASGSGGSGAAEWPGLDRVREAARSLARGDRVLQRAVRAARAGRVFSHEELLALQAGVYRHTQELELASKLVDKGTSAVKHVLQSQR